MVELSLFLLGISIGLSSAFLGVGGGLIMVPLLPLFIPLSPAETVATSLFVVMVTVFINSVSFIRAGLVVWPCAFYISMGSLSFAMLLAYMSVQAEGAVFRLGLAATLLVVLLNPMSILNVKRGGVKEFILGCCGGTLTGVSGVGGAILSPLLFQFKWLPEKQIVPTVNIVMFTTCLGTIISLSLGHPQHLALIHGEPALILLVGSFLSSFAGRHFNLGSYERKRCFFLKLLVFLLLIKVLSEFFFNI